jgi:hypothetical protein
MFKPDLCWSCNKEQATIESWDGWWCEKCFHKWQ